MSKKAVKGRHLSALVGTPLREIKEEFISVAEMQNRIMPDPERMTVFPGFDIYGKTIPVAIVGGDFFDFIDIEERFGLEDRMGFVIADAAGHGLSAAMLVRDFNTALYTAISLQAHYEHDTTPLLLDKINRRMFRSSLPNQFISAFYGELRHDGRLRYVNAGHLPPLVFGPAGERELLDGGPVLGAFLDLPRPYAVGETFLEPGETFLAYTDGIVESMRSDDTEYGLERLQQVVTREQGTACRNVFNAVLDDLDVFAPSRRQADDRTIVLIHREGTGELPGTELVL